MNHDVWFTLNLGNIKTDDDGASTYDAKFNRMVRLTSYGTIYIDAYRRELHKQLDEAISYIALDQLKIFTTNNDLVAEYMEFISTE